jgi:hypothetical protein
MLRRGSKAHKAASSGVHDESDWRCPPYRISDLGGIFWSDRCPRVRSCSHLSPGDCRVLDARARPRRAMGAVYLLVCDLFDGRVGNCVDHFNVDWATRWLVMNTNWHFRVIGHRRD